jgi:hypothetical protein
MVADETFSTAACSCCTCQGVDHPTTGWQPLGMLGDHLVEACPAHGCCAGAILPVDGYDVMDLLVARLEALGCDPQPVDGGAR